MKKSVGFLILSLLFGGLIVFISLKYSETKNFQKQVSIQKSYIASMEANVKVALELVKTRIWYVVNERTVSTLPNGKGERIYLGDTSLLAIGNRLGIKHPDYNRRVSFLPSESRSEAYVVAGGWLTYQYLD